MYNIAAGELLNLTYEYSGYTQVIHNSYFDVNFIYMHTKNPKYSVGSTIPTQAHFADQGRFKTDSIDNTHTHFEVVSSNQLEPRRDKDNAVYSQNPYTPAIFWIP